MISFRAKIKVIPNVSYERALICTIKYICYEYSLTNNKTNCVECLPSSASDAVFLYIMVASDLFIAEGYDYDDV